MEGIRAASRVRVDQLHAEYLWIKSALAPLAGILLPASESAIYKAWQDFGTVEVIATDAERRNYLPPFGTTADSASLAAAMCRIGVVQRRDGSRLDMPDLYRVAAKLLKKGGQRQLDRVELRLCSLNLAAHVAINPAWQAGPDARSLA
jgi:hypothetical protein